MGLIEDFVKEESEIIIPTPPVRFSVNIDYILNFRLQYIAKRLDYNRQALTERFIDLAVQEAEKALEIHPFDFESEYGKQVFENCGGAFYQDETGYYRLTSSGKRIKLVDSNDESEIDYSLGKKEYKNND